MPDRVSDKLTTRTLEIVNDDGNPRIVLNAAANGPKAVFLDRDGEPRMAISLSEEGMAAIELTSPLPAGPVLRVELDDKGSHVIFEHPDGASGWLFLNNEGRSGLVLNDANGGRGYAVTLAADGALTTHPHMQGTDNG